MPYKPYYKRPYRRRRRYSRGERNARRLGRRAGSTAYQALKTARYVRSLVNTEFKSHDWTVSVNPVITPALSYLSTIPQDNTSTGRNGKQVRIKSLSIRGRLSMNSAANTGQRVRIIIFKVPYQNEVSSVATDILTTAAIDSLYSLDNSKRFQVMFDHTYRLKPNDNTDIPIKWYFKQNCIFSAPGTGTAVTDCERNGYHVLYMSDTNTNTPTLVLNGRFRFIDN